MKTLFESLIDIDSLETDINTTKYLSNQEFRDLYKRVRDLIDINGYEQVCIAGDTDSMQGLCQNFKAKNINIGGIYPKSKIKTMAKFANNCEYVKTFKGPNAHINYSEVSSLSNFFSEDMDLEDFDLSGIAKSTRNIKEINRMFYDCDSIKIIDLSSFNFSNLNNCDNSFANCSSLRQIDLGNSDTIIEANDMCMQDSNLKEFNAPNMILRGDYIFDNCTSLRNINVKYIDVSRRYNNIFDGCTKLENVNIFGFNGATMINEDYIDMTWAISLSNKSWDYLFENLGDGKSNRVNRMNVKIKLPDTSKKEKLIEKYSSVAEQHNFTLI